MSEGYELYTVRQAAALLVTSEAGVRARVKSGKLDALKKNGRLLFTSEALQRYAASLPHPVPVMAAMHYARLTLSLGTRLEQMQWHAPQGLATWLRVLWPELAPLCRALLDAVKVKNYGEVERLSLETYRLTTDYEMSYPPMISKPTPPQTRGTVPREQAPLFPIKKVKHEQP